jgi:hypothetical protein
MLKGKKESRVVLLVLLMLLLILWSSSAQAFSSIKDSLLPAVKNGGFQMNGYFLWCPSVIKVDNTYHLFCSRWPEQYGMNGWSTYSECVRATSSNLYGPYTFQEVVLQKRSGYWDNDRVHNVRIVKAGTKYVLFYISSKMETGYAEANAITGPWTRTSSTVMSITNPAPLVKSDGSMYVFGRGDQSGVNIAIGYTAPSYQGPYSLLNGGNNLLPNNYELEDPTIWWANNQYNVICNDWNAKATGLSKGGAQYYSTNGIQYQLVTSDPVFTKTVTYDDQTTETFSRRERPWVYVNDQSQVTAFFTACLPTSGPSRIVVQPVNNYYPGTSTNLVQNGDFSNGATGWSLYNNAAAGASSTFSVVSGEAYIDIINGSTVTYYIQFKQNGLNVENGKSYTVSFDARSVSARPIEVEVIMDVTPYTSYSGIKSFNLTTTKTNYNFTFTMSQPTDGNARLRFRLGNNANSVYIDNVVLKAN